MKKERPVLFRPTPKQAAYISASEREVLIAGGSGSGKSLALLMAAAHGTGQAGHRALIIRRSFAELRELLSKSLTIFPSIGGTYHASTTTWRFKSGAEIELGYCDSHLDHARYLGRQWNFIGIDELCEYGADTEDANGEPCSSTYLFLMSRLRSPVGTNLPLEIRATAVASGVGKLFVQQRWQIPPEGGDTLVVDPSTGLHRRFIFATVADNEHLGGEDGQYAQTLKALPQHQRAAWLHGRWDAVSGSSMFPEWDAAVHLVAPFDIPRTWKFYRACDDGYNAPMCVLWCAHDADTTDTIYVVRELYPSTNTATCGRAILDIDEQVVPGVRWGGPIDTSAFVNLGTGTSRGHAMNELGCNWRPVEKGTGSIQAGLSAIHARLAKRDGGMPGLRVFKGMCPNLVRELTAAVTAPNNCEVLDPSCPDHSIDALRYLVSYKRPWTKVVKVKWAF